MHQPDCPTPPDGAGVAARAFTPTQALPGSEGKLAVLAARAAAGQPLHHPLDAIAPIGAEQHRRAGHDAPGERRLPRGVRRRGNRFLARVTLPGKGRMCLGLHATAEGAAAAIEATLADHQKEMEKAREAG